MSIPWLTAACAKIMKVIVGQEVFLGTGYLIAPKWVATAEHVVEEIAIGQALLLRFPDMEPMRAFLRHKDVVPSDCALLELEQALPSDLPLRLATVVPDRGRWLGYGFPDGAKNHGLPLKGEIVLSVDTDPSEHGPAIQLELDKSVSGDMRGYSGGPVTDEGRQRVLGHFIVRIPDRDGSAQFARMWACPGKQIAALCQRAAIQIDNPPPQLREVEPPYTYDLSCQVRKREEAAAHRLLKEPGPPVFLVGPMGCGKTLLWSALISRIRIEHSDKVVDTGLDQFDESERTDLNSFLKAWALSIAKQLGVDHGLVEEVWKRPYGAKSKLNAAMEDHFLSKVPDNGRLVVAMEQLDDLWARPFADDFFELLKSWADASAMNRKSWGKLRMLFSTSISPTYLVRGKGTSLYPRPVDLCDLDASQIAEMVSHYCLHSMDSIREALIEQVGGNPYLVMLAMHHLAAGRLTAGELLSEQGLMLAFGRHLLDLQQWLEQHQARLSGLQAILTGTPAQVPQEVIVALLRRGLVISDAQGHRVRYGLYRKYFAGYFKQCPQPQPALGPGAQT